MDESYENALKRLAGLRDKLREINSLIDRREATIASIQRQHADLRASWDKMAEDDVFLSFTPDYAALDHGVRIMSVAAADRDQLLAAYNEIHDGCRDVEETLKLLQTAKERKGAELNEDAEQSRQIAIQDSSALTRAPKPIEGARRYKSQGRTE
ncbi:MAG: hypothetical protein AAGJ28_06045 [Pseudomonadota bacterium]